MQTRKITHPITLIFIAATAGAAGIHYYLTQQHIQIKYGFGEGSSVCNISDFFNCNTSIVSSYSEIFGIPLAIFGLFTNLVILYFTLKSLVQSSEEKQQNSASVALTFSGVAAVASLVMAGISLLVLKSLCPFCTAAYILSFITLGTCFSLFKPTLKGLDFTRSLRSLLLASVFVAVGSFAYGKINLQKYTSKEIQELSQLKLDQWKKEAASTIDIVEPLTFGPDAAKMKIVEYADFLCPHCKVAYNKLHTLAKTNTDIQIIFQSFPLDGCSGPAENPGLRCQLAMAAYCSQQIAGKGWRAHEYIFGSQEEIAESGSITSTIEKLSSSIGIDTAKIESCMKDTKTLDVVKKQVEGGKKVGVEGTPTLFINNKRFMGAPHLPLLIDIYKNISGEKSN